MPERIEKTDEEWRQELTPEQHRVLRRKGTERAFKGAYWDTKADGEYRCAACGLALFSSEHKFDSGTGWPSFWQAVADGSIETEEDNSLFSKRTEVHCRRCGGHLGHLFEDGPKPTGLRYCVNSVSLDFSEK
jgi:peptide-methionine (R)-S-oxide reductase